MRRPRTLKGTCDEELLLSNARLDADFGTDNFARNDDFEAAVFLAAAAAPSSAKGCLGRHQTHAQDNQFFARQRHRQFLLLKFHSRNCVTFTQASPACSLPTVLSLGPCLLLLQV
jgi:hypothetical protein